MSKDYWSGEFVDLLNDGVAEDKKEQSSIPQVENIDEIVENGKDSLMREFEKLALLTASNLHKGVLSDADVDVGKLMRQFESNLANRMSRTLLSVQASPMPPGTRFALPFGNSIVYVIEHEPCVRSIYHSQGINGKASLAFPYMVFGTLVDKNRIPGHLHIGCSNKSLSSLDDRLERIHLSNIYQSFNKMGVCDSSISGGSAAKKGSTVAEKVEAVITQFWASQWNGAGMTSECKDSKVTTIASWEKNTKKDPMFSLKVKWQSAGINVRQFAEGLAGSKIDEEKKSHARLDTDFRGLGRELVGNVTNALNLRLEEQGITFRDE